VACAVVQSLQSDRTGRPLLQHCGAAPVTLNEIIDTAAALAGAACSEAAHPAGSPWWPCCVSSSACACAFQFAPSSFSRLDEDKAFSYEEAARDFAFSAGNFRRWPGPGDRLAGG
jgi:hypothetical protein